MGRFELDPTATWRGRVLLDAEGARVGRIADVYLDNASSARWALVNTELFNTRWTLVPLVEALSQAEDVRVPYSMAMLQGAPMVDPDETLPDAGIGALYLWYGLERGR
jgi:hypothetical protein